METLPCYELNYKIWHVLNWIFHTNSLRLQRVLVDFKKYLSFGFQNKNIWIFFNPNIIVFPRKISQYIPIYSHNLYSVHVCRVVHYDSEVFWFKIFTEILSLWNVHNSPKCLLLNPRTITVITWLPFLYFQTADDCS